ncbi:MAG TPA: hypothetical protein VHB77_23375, partial [Planctomycetaceae bacterium]|nr:hypothetical protein [Planctomycetaceae bacterium]
MAKESPTPDQAEEASAPADAPAPAAKPKRRRRRWFLRLFLFLTIVGLALIGAAPTLVTSTPLGPRLLPYVAPGVDVEFESLSGGWFAPLAARKIALLDRDGTRLVEVAEITTEKTLLHLVGGYRNLGTIHVVGPRVSVTFRPDGSNLEDALARLMPASSSSSTPIAYSLDVQNGVVELVDADGSQGTLQNVSCTIEQTAGEAAALKLNASASSGLDGQSGRVTAEVTSSGGEAKVTLRCDAFDASKLTPLLQRFAHGMRVEGLLKSDLELTARTDEQGVMTASLSGPLSASGVGVQLPGMHETEQIRLEKVDVGGRLALHGSQLTAVGFSIDSELGQLKLTGNVGVAALAGLTSPDQIAAALGTDDFHGEGEIDIAKLIAHLPRTLRLRDDVQVSQGRLEFKLDSKPEEASRVWQGRLAASKFAARIEGQNLTWDQPLEVTLAAHQNTAGISIDKLLCRSEFVQLLLKGTLEQAVFKARCDLHGLFAEVQRFADLGQVEAAGKLYLRCDWSATPDAPLKAELQALGEQVAFVWPGRKPWREERLEIVGSATGAMLARGVPRFDTATLNLTSGNDHFDGELQQPLTWPLSETPAAVKVHFGGTLQTWLARLQPVVALQGCELQGVLTGDVRVSVSRDACA